MEFWEPILGSGLSLLGSWLTEIVVTNCNSMTMQYIHLDRLAFPCQVQWSSDLYSFWSDVRDELATVLKRVCVHGLLRCAWMG